MVFETAYPSFFCRGPEVVTASAASVAYLARTKARTKAWTAKYAAEAAEAAAGTQDAGMADTLTVPRIYRMP